MGFNKRVLTRILVLAALTMGILAAVPASAATVNLEGMIVGGTAPECVLVRDHQGNTFLLEGSGWYGVIGNDYVRLEGTIVPETRCGVTSAIQIPTGMPKNQISPMSHNSWTVPRFSAP